MSGKDPSSARPLNLEHSRLADIFQQTPAFVAVVAGPEHVFELANPPYMQLVGHREILGKPIREALPEVAGQGFFKILDGVYATGVPFRADETRVLLQRKAGGPLEERFVTFIYQPLLDADGTISGIFVHGVDVTETKRVGEALKEAGRRKDEFLAMLGHELRNPLSPIRNAVQILRQSGVENPLVVRAREMIARQVSHMTRMVDDLLDVSRISNGKILVRKEPVDIAALLHDTAEDYRESLEAAGTSLKLSLPSGPVWVHGDPTRLSQAVGNLLNNAEKYTGHGQVRLTAQPLSGQATVEICVEDNGVGMDPGLLDRLFEPFSQGDRSLDRARGGLGLGLALAKGLVELHDGEIEASSAGPGQGACFTIRLPLASSPEPAKEEAAPDLRGLSRRIVVIEDNVDAAESLQLLLEIWGHQVEMVHDGPAGLEAVRRFEPDVVLCDIGLPGGMDGYEVARRLRSAGTTARLVALTGYGQQEDQRRALDAGFDLHLTKPVEPAALQKLLAAPEALPVR
ncbi:MAG TPA: ATP-binding protein [Thermoanaerobaculia bacterium]|nr:ATP-binding protein [Thermoanaerobaculia bacterium]